VSSKIAFSSDLRGASRPGFGVFLGLKSRGLGIFAKSGCVCTISPNLLSAVVMAEAAAAAVATVALA